MRGVLPEREAKRRKMEMAVRLRAEMAVTVRWIAERLRMGAAGYVNHPLYRQRKAEEE